MKDIAVVAFTKSSEEISEVIVKLLNRHKYECVMHNAGKSASEVEAISTLRTTKNWVDEHWKKIDAFIFIGGADIATRMIAGFLDNRMSDPAVVVIDEECRYVIPLLGSHLGLGNDIAEKIAKLVNGKEIITTPKEITEKFSIEKFAERNHMEIGNRDQARAISASIVEGQHVGFYSEYDIEGEIPVGLTLCHDKKELDWFSQRISIKSEYIIGMGLKEGALYSNIETLFLNEVDSMKIDMAQIKGIATIQDKKDEPALVTLSEKYRIPILSFTGKELRNFNVKSSHDPSVKNEANISERAALMGSEGGELVKAKVVGKGATFAAARLMKIIYFD